MSDGLRMYFAFLWFAVRYLVVLGVAFFFMLGLVNVVGGGAGVILFVLIAFVIAPLLIFCGNPNWRIAKVARWWLAPPFE